MKLPKLKVAHKVGVGAVVVAFAGGAAFGLSGGSNKPQTLKLSDTKTPPIAFNATGKAGTPATSQATAAPANNSADSASSDSSAQSGSTLAGASSDTDTDTPSTPAAPAPVTVSSVKITYGLLQTNPGTSDTQQVTCTWAYSDGSTQNYTFTEYVGSGNVQDSAHNGYGYCTLARAPTPN